MRYKTRKRRTKIKQKRGRRKKKLQPKKKPTLRWNNRRKFVQNDGARFEVYPMRGDGNCLFRAMSYFVLGRQANHDFVRNEVVNYISDHWDLFKNFASEPDVEDYRKEMNSPGTYGGEAELVAFSEIFGCNVHVFFKDAPERSPLTFGDFSTNCYVMYSGIPDAGHYDVLLPTTKRVCNLQLYKESIRQLRDATAVEFGSDLADFKDNKK